MRFLASNSKHSIGFILCLMSLFLVLNITLVHAANITANDAATLIAAINTANDEITNPGVDTIILDADIVLIAPLDENAPTGHTALPAITSEIVIAGNRHSVGRDTSLNAQFRIFEIAPSGNLTLNKLSVIGAYNSVGTGGCPPKACGGAVYVDQGSLTLTNSTISGNIASFGGGIYNRNGTVTIFNSLIIGNDALGSGGGIYNETGLMTITDSVITANSAYGNGGGIVNTGNISIVNTTISENTVGQDGGGIYNFFGGILSMSGGAIFDNTAGTMTGGNGGGIYNQDDGTMDISDAAIIYNKIDDIGSGGGIFNNGALTLTNTALENNTAGNEGGAVVNRGNLDITDSLLASNRTGAIGSAFHNNADAISASIENSCIFENQNSVTTISNASATSLPAVHNWWGSATGPAGVGSGTGNSVGTNVAFVPFLPARPRFCLSVPTLRNPTDAPQSQLQPNFYWRTVYGATRYEIQVDGIVHSANTNYFTLRYPLTVGVHKWRVRAGDNTGSWSNWSEQRLLNIISPTNAAPMLSYYTSATPTLTWNRVSWATEYELQIAVNPNFNPSFYATIVAAPTLAITFSPPGLPNATYYWRVRARNGPTIGMWSSINTFTVDS